MKKNVVFFLVDSVTYDYVMDSEIGKTPMPFFNSLKEKGLWCENMYAQAPFTEAAVNPLLSGINLLDKGGYLERFTYRKTIDQYFKEAGYQTFLNHYYPCIYPSHIYKGVDVLHWQTPFDPSQLWDYRLAYYRPLYLENKLSEREINILIELVEDNFKAWIYSDELLYKKDEKVRLIYKYTDLTGLDKEIEALKAEYKKFQNNKLEYLDNLLKTDSEHPLFKIPMRKLHNKVSPEDREIITKRYRKTFERIYELNKKYNSKNLKFPLGRITSSILDGNFYDAKQYAAMYKNAVYDKDLFDRIDGNYPSFNAALCMRSFVEDGFSLLDEKWNKENPFFFYFHVDDAHSPENIFSSDCTDLKVLDEEFNNINEYLDNLSDKFYGSLTMTLSLKYVDGCLKLLFDKLKEKNLLDDTVVVITADHGFSYSYRNLRTNYVNNSHSENYHTPFLVYDSSRKPKTVTKYTQENDIVPTILDYCGIEIPDEINGKSILSEGAGRDYAITEYMGGGCPDMKRRPMILQLRNKDYLLVININVNDNFENFIVTDLYDLQNDKNEIHNLAKKYKKYDLEKEFLILRNRFEEIKTSYFTTKNSFNN